MTGVNLQHTVAWECAADMQTEMILTPKTEYDSIESGISGQLWVFLPRCREYLQMYTFSLF